MPLLKFHNEDLESTKKNLENIYLLVFNNCNILFLLKMSPQVIIM